MDLSQVQKSAVLIDLSQQDKIKGGDEEIIIVDTGAL